MCTTRHAITTAVRGYVQEVTSLPLLANADADYELAIEAALPVFSLDRPNLRVVQSVLAAATRRVVLAGTGAVVELTGLDAWTVGGCAVTAVGIHDDPQSPDAVPLDDNEWRVRLEPGGEALILATAVGPGTLRMEFTAPHVVHASEPAQTSLRPGDVTLVHLLTASVVAQMWATRLAQNTGGSAIPGDIVDRRSQSDVARSRAKELRDLYHQMLGRDRGGTNGPASAVRDFDVETGHGRGFLFHPTRSH